MKTYKVKFKYSGEGCAYIDADSAKEAEYKFERGEFDPDVAVLRNYEEDKIIGRTVIYKKKGGDKGGV